MKTITSNALTFIDQTDSRKFEAHISSNLPQVQIYDQNNKTYSPDWSNAALTLQASIYLDSTDITVNTDVAVEWYKNSISTATKIGNGKTLTINTNVLSTEPIITYICQAKYQNLTTSTRTVYTRIDSGVNGSSGTSAPAVQAQYSVDSTAWTAILNAAAHKYIRYSYDGGKTWTTAIKMVGEDGKSVAIKGTATSVTAISGTDYYTVTYGGASITTAVLGDSYLYGGDLYVCSELRDGADYFINVGKIQGAKGNDGESSYVYIRYATSSSGANMTTNPSSQTTYIGIHVSSATTAPTTANSYTWSKFVGDSAKNIVLSGDSQVFKVSTSSAYTPTTIKVTAQTLNTSVTAWTYNINDGKGFVSTLPTGVTRSGNIVTITGADLATNSVVIKASDGTVEDIFTVYKAFDGVDGNPGNPGAPASMAFLTNENVTFGANASGQILATTFSTSVVAYNGTTKVTPTIGDISGLPTGITTSVGAAVNNEIPITFTIANNSTLGSALNNNGSITIPVNTPVSTKLILNWSKVNSGAQGPQGNRGSDAYTVLLTNESHIFAGDISNAVDGSATTQVLAYNGTAAQTVTITSVNGKTAAIVDADTGIAGLKFKCSTLKGTSPTITFTCTTSFVSDSGTIPIVLSVGGVSITKMFAYSIAFKGATGEIGAQGPQGVSATSYWLVSSASVVQKTSTGTITVTPSALTFTGKSKTGTNAPIDYACRWVIDVSTDGTTYTNISTSAANETSKAITVLTTYKTIRARMYMAGGTTALLDEQIIPVVSDGAKGDTGRGVSKITEYYLATTAASGVTTSTSGWTPAVQTIDDAKKYLWNYELITYTDNTTSTTTPVIIGVFGNTGATGKGIKSVTEYYLATSSSSGVTTSTSGWKDTMQALTATNKYLWNYELITYTDNTTATINPVIIGVYGDQGKQGPKGNDAYTVMLTNESHIFAGDISNAIVGSATTQVLAYNGATAQTVTIVSVNGKTASTADTDTGIAGLKFKCSALSGTSPTITFTCTTSFVSKSGSIPIVLSVGGVSFTKIFTYSIAFKGTTGNPGTPASLVNITPSALYFKSTTGKDGAFTPDYIYLYPRFQTVAYSKWEYSTNGGSSWTTVASGSNGLTIGTYNSIAYSLQIAKNSALYTDTVTSISFRCVSSNSAVYDTVSIAKIYDVVDLQIGGTNLIPQSKMDQQPTTWSQNDAFVMVTEDGYNCAKLTSGISIYKTPNVNIFDKLNTINLAQEYTISAWIKVVNYVAGTTNPYLSLYIDGKKASDNSWMGVTNVKGSGSLHVYNNQGWKKIEWTIKFAELFSEMKFFVYSRDCTGDLFIRDIKMEKGNKATDWSPAPEDLNNITFQIYAPNGYLLTNELSSLTLQTFAYEGSIEIASGATFQWSHLIDDVWTNISEATDTTLTVTKADVLKAKSYRCVMTYKEKTYTSTITVQDKTDIYNSIMCISSNTISNDCYWVLHTVVYSDADEVDPLLGPISISEPTSPVNGDYWYSVDTSNATVTLKKYNGTSWANSTDTQSLSYSWNIMSDGGDKIPLVASAKVKVISCHDFTNTATIMCEVSDSVDGVLTQSSLSLTDASDPIVSDTEPTATVNGQIWIKRNANGTYLMFVWDENTQSWISSDMDSRSKVHTSKPSSYNAGDLWITASNNDYGGYYALATTYSPNIKYYVLSNGAYTLASTQPTSDAEVLASQYYRYITYLQGTLLQAKKSSTTYNAADWSPTLRYDNDFDDLKDRFEQLSQYVSISTDGLRMAARNENDELSPFTALFTSTDLSFYQNSEKLLILANNQLTAPRVVVEDALEVQGSISLGDLRIIIENNGSFSFAIKQ